MTVAMIAMVGKNFADLALKAMCLAAPLLVGLAPLPARADSAAASYFVSRAERSAVPRLLTDSERAFYCQLFAAIHRGDWVRVQSLFAQTPDGPLHAVARGEYYRAPGSPRIDLDALNQWLASGTDLPEADAIAALALKRGALAVPALPQPQPLLALPSAPRRALPRATNDTTMSPATAGLILARIKADDSAGAKALLDAVDPLLSDEARAEWRQRVAWSYYIENDNPRAYAMARSAARGGPLPAFAAPLALPAAPSGEEPSAALPSPGTVAGPWTAEAWWTAGLAAWRMGHWAEASDGFAAAAQAATNPELAAAAAYWQSRAAVRGHHPELAAAALRRAAALDETMYGMLAAEQLGKKLPQGKDAPDFSAADWLALRDVTNVRVAVGLAEVGEDGLADEVLRHQARIGAPQQFQPLSRLARDLGLAGTQLWMAYNAPAGVSPPPASRYPTPKWTPTGGWRVDPALILAHSLQESQFHTGAVSPAGARGLMQVRLAAAREHAGELGITGTADDLARPETNLALGQLYLQGLRNCAATGGLLPKVIAAYNAGPLPIARWNGQIAGGTDPLLWIESVPYWETRAYVATVLRNYWMYERQAGGMSDSRTALAAGLWPTFPGLDGGHAVRLGASGQPQVERLASGD